MIVVDTDILIWILRGRESILDLFKKKIEKQNKIFFITAIQIAEIYAGVREAEKIVTERLIKSFNILKIDEKVGELAGKYLNRYLKSNNVTLSDAMIAAVTVLNDMKLWTLNKKHYPMLEEKVFEN